MLDNSYYQFLYDKKKFDLILKFYIYDGDERPEGISSIQGVRFGSFIHKVLFLLSSVILTSYSNFESFSPFKKSFKEYRDKVKFKTIYLQHGILHAKLREMYTQEKNSIDKVVVSSYFEKENFVKNYNYREEDLLESGMPRLDRLGIKKIKGSKKILLAPSWRQYLLGAFVDNKWEVDNKQFMSSYFFKSLHQFLSSKKLKSILEKSHSILELKLHPNFSGYKSCFKLDGQVIKFSDDIVNPSDYDLLITDYSSYVFDYVYCNIPVIYFLPDREEFEAGLGTYRELDLPLEEGFGPITENSEDLIKEIKSIVKNNFEIDKKYRNRYRNFFITKENHREKLYKELKKLK